MEKYNLCKMPAAALAVPLIAGMMMAVGDWMSLIIRIFALIVMVLSIVLSVRFRPLWEGIIVSLLVAFVGWRLMTDETASTEFPAEWGQRALTAKLLLTAEPVEKGVRLRCDVRVVEDGDHTWQGRDLQVYIPKDDNAAALRMGDCILARFTPRPPVNRSADFDYVSYLRGKGFTATSYISQQDWRKSKTADSMRLRVRAMRLRDRLVQTLEDNGIDCDRLALVSALSLGRKDLMDSEMRDRFAGAGVSHVLAVSGMHVGIVYSFVNAVVALIWSFISLIFKNLPQRFKYLLRLLRCRCRFARSPMRLVNSADRSCDGKPKRANPLRHYRRNRVKTIVKQLIVVSVLWAYAFVTGLPASVVRAVTMFTLSAGAVCSGRRSQTWNNLFLTAFLMLCMQPSYLMDIGFQMSFIAVAAILFFLPVFEQLLGIERQEDMQSFFGAVRESHQSCMVASDSRPCNFFLRRVGRYVVSSLLISVAAQTGTAPLSIYHFHRYPQWFMLSNLVLIPLAVALTWIALTFQCLAAIPFVPATIVRAAAILLSLAADLFTGIAFFVESLPGAVVNGLLPTTGEILASYLLIGSLFYFFQKKNYLYTLENVIRRIRGMKYNKFLKHK